jgi:hypothetical protein
MGQISPCWASSKPLEQTCPCPRFVRGLPRRGLGAPLIHLRPQPMGSRTQDDPQQYHRLTRAQRWHYPSLTRLRPIPDAALPLARSRPPMTSPTFSRLPNQIGQEWPGSNHHILHCNKHGRELLTTMPPMMALYTRFMCRQSTDNCSGPLFPWSG